MDNKENKFICSVETKVSGNHSITVGKRSFGLRHNFPINLELTKDEYATLKSNKYLEVKLLQEIKANESVSALPKTDIKQQIVADKKEENKLVEVPLDDIKEQKEVEKESKIVEVPLDDVKEQKEEIVKKIVGNNNDKNKNKRNK